MGKVQVMQTANFTFYIVASATDGTINLLIRPRNKTGKDLFRFKQWGKEYGQTVTRAEIFDYVDSFEDKLKVLNSI